MNAMTCDEVQEQLDLLAAGECDRPVRDAALRHLDECRVCAAGYAESQRLLGLLDLQWHQAALERLRQRIEQQEEQAAPRRAERRKPPEAGRAERRKPPGNTRRYETLLPFVRRAGALAALFLMTVGLLWLWSTDQRGSEPALALLVRESEKIDVRALDNVPATFFVKGVEALVAPAPGGPGGVALRNELLKAQREGKPPAPPRVPLELRIKNVGNRPVRLQLGDSAAELLIDVQGDGVVRMPAAPAEEPEFLRRRSVSRDPGKELIVYIDRLISGSRGRLEYIYLTEPVDYAVTPRLRLTADGHVVTVVGETIHIKVGK
jgi:hypothetical protein